MQVNFKALVLFCVKTCGLLDPHTGQLRGAAAAAGVTGDQRALLLLCGMDGSRQAGGAHGGAVPAAVNLCVKTAI